VHVVGLTGGFCCGKSFVLKVLEEQGCYTMRADDLAKTIIMAKDSPVLEKIIELLFEDLEKRNFVNTIVHPQVSAERRNKIRAIEATKIYDFFIYESALLVESGINKEFEKIIVVYTSPEIQIARAEARDKLSPLEAEKRIKSQFPLKEKLKVANYTIDSSGTFDSTRANTMEVFYLLKKDFHLS
jgi:dephospho-CoA kinase